MKTLRIFCLSFVVVVFLVGPLVTTSLSTTEMKSTWGGVLCGWFCKGERTCPQRDCYYRSTMNDCYAAEGDTYWVCERTGGSDTCSQQGTVSCGWYKRCVEGTQWCGPGNPVCQGDGCEEGTKKMTGCRT